MGTKTVIGKVEAMLALVAEIILSYNHSPLEKLKPCWRSSLKKILSNHSQSIGSCEQERTVSNHSSNQMMWRLQSDKLE